MATTGAIVSVPEQKTVTRSRVQLVLLVALFMVPPVAAWVAWKTLGTEGVEATTNAGVLVAPPRPLQVGGLYLADGAAYADRDLRGRWTYVVFGGADCDSRCEQQLYLTRQTRIAMNKDVPRIQRLLVLSQMPSGSLAERLASEHEDLRWVVLGEDAGPLLQRFEGDRFKPQGEQYFLVDPLGNLMMYYTLDVPAKGMMKDLQKLLKISQIG